MMFASKMPSLRIDQNDLKCKNGCDYYGNPQWQGYCSKCHREEMNRQRRAEKHTSSSTLPKPDQKKSERLLKVTSRSSFSKFEEKRQRQSETLKKANLLKFSVFKKNTTEEQGVTERRPPEFKVPSMVYEGMKRDFRVRFPTLSQQIDKDTRAFVHTFIMDVMKYANVMNVDELSDRVQRHYQRFMKLMDTTPYFANVETDTKELLMDFVEKHAMTYLHELPSVVFSPIGTDDERADRAMSERIQQLSWVGEKHLECKINRDSQSCRQLLYKAISELLGMDRSRSPGGKLSRARRCCRHVLALCETAPASADDLLPALIFTVLKANPPRLVSNINFVTRFCNAQRLMTGEGGYYFTNLCCAVSFIESLNAESLNMDKKEFECYMAMPASIGGSSWAAALSLCAELRECEESRGVTDQLLTAAADVRTRAAQLAADGQSFQEEIAKKVQDVLSKTPLEITPRRELPRLWKSKQIKTGSLIDLDNSIVSTETTESVAPDNKLSSLSVEAEDTPTKNEGLDQNEQSQNDQRNETVLQTLNDSNNLELDRFLVQNIQENFKPNSIIDQSCFQKEKPQNSRNYPNGFDPPLVAEHAEPKLSILGFEVIDISPTKSHHIDNWDLRQTNSLELLTPSPLGFTPFDSRSIDELLTPDEFAPGLSNINYDIDLSDFSGDNSRADDSPKPKDPFSPEGVRKEIVTTFSPQPPQDPFSPVMNVFDQFNQLDLKTDLGPFEFVPRTDRPFVPSAIVSDRSDFDLFSVPGQSGPTSILDDQDNSTAACFLPSPLQPQCNK